MLRSIVRVLPVSLLVLAVAEIASATTIFVDLSANLPAGAYTQADPEGVTAGGGVVMQTSNAPSGTRFYWYATYSGGASGTYTTITGSGAGNVAKESYCGAVVASGANAGEWAFGAQSTQLNSPYTTSNGGSSAFLFSNLAGGSATQLPLSTPGGYTPLFATGIDSAGEICGLTSIGGGWGGPFVYTAGTTHDLPLPADDTTSQYGGIGYGMSPNGKYVAGNWFYDISPSVPYGVAACWTRNSNGSWASTPTVTDISGGTYAGTIAVAVNNSGQAVVGESSSISSPTSVELYQIGTGQTTALTGLYLGCPTKDILAGVAGGYGGGFQQCINSAGQVVGYEVVSGANHAAVWQNGTLTDLQTEYGPSGLNILPSGFVLNNATAIDNNGDIVGYGTDSASHASQAFVIIQPVATPEPSTLLLAASGLAGLLAGARGRRK